MRERNDLNQPIRAVYGGEVVTQTASFDRALGRLGRLTADTGSDSPSNLAYQVTQTFDGDGRVATREYGHQLPALKAHHSFAYDGLGRLSEWKLGPTANQQERTTYAFTVAGNLDVVNHYDAADALQSAESYGYKLEQPHLVETKGPWSYSYDGEGRRLESFSGGQLYASFNYDSFDKPASGTVDGTSFSSVRDAAGNAPSAYCRSGFDAIHRRTVRAPTDGDGPGDTHLQGRRRRKRCRDGILRRRRSERDPSLPSIGAARFIGHDLQRRRDGRG